MTAAASTVAATTGSHWPRGAPATLHSTAPLRVGQALYETSLAPPQGRSAAVPPADVYRSCASAAVTTSPCAAAVGRMRDKRIRGWQL